MCGKMTLHMLTDAFIIECVRLLGETTTCYLLSRVQVETLPQIAGKFLYYILLCTCLLCITQYLIHVTCIYTQFIVRRNHNSVNQKSIL